jgi:tetratricopeptide (TPR) repeat protein
MSILDFFRKEKDLLADLPPAMRQAYNILFPKGVADHDRQLTELCKHYGTRYKREDINSNLIYILTGFLITGNTKTKESAVEVVLSRNTHKMDKQDVEYLYTFALSNHPKLAPLLTIQSVMDNLSHEGCETDTMPGGIGLFGYSQDNPIPTKGVAGSYEYLDHLRDCNGNKISYKRLGTTGSNVSDSPIDVYEITSPTISQPINLFVSAYQKRNSQLSPSDFILVDGNNIVISSGGTSFGIGQRCVPNTKPNPQLTAINYFGLISPSDYNNYPQNIVDAEKLNRQGFIKSNDGDTNGAIMILKEAVEKGSVNAINSLFAVLHCAERYQEAHDSLKNALQHEHRSAALYYNIAVIYSGYDTRYPVKPNYSVVVSCLKKAIALPDDGLEEYRSKIQEKAKAFLDDYNKDTELHKNKN